MMFKNIVFEKENGIAVIRLNRPEVMNAFDIETQEELAEAIDNIHSDGNARVLIVTGTGRAFCAGIDISALEGMNANQGREFLKKVHQMMVNLVSMEKPVIAAVNGFALGGGCNLALASDIIVASENAKFSQGFVKIGLVSDMGGMYFLPRLIGLAKAKELMFFGKTMDAKEAERIGMINRVVPEADLERVANELAMEMARGPLKPIGLMKAILNKSTHLDFRSLLELEFEAQMICSQTEDHKKGIQAFLERKKKIRKEICAKDSFHKT